MKVTLPAFIVLATVTATSAAFAADLRKPMPTKAPLAAPPPLAPTWTGLYLGGHVGYLWGNTRIDHAETGGLAALGPTDGVIGGVLGGLNWQTGSIVLGAEADIGWTNAKGNGAALPPSTEFFTYKIESTSHFRGRLGYDLNGTLIYLAGGLAIAKAHVQEFEMSNLIAVCGGTYTGSSIGGGLERIFTPQISGRVEYLYDNFGHKSYSTGDDMYRVGITGHTVRVGLVFRLPPNGP
jgi:outer membrane immunogenic protein